MFFGPITSACTRFPNSNVERFFIYPALAVYSPLENSIKTSVGGFFTILSLASLGICPPINNGANWTRYSRGILTIPIQIIGNIFKIHTEILTRYNIAYPYVLGSVNLLINSKNIEQAQNSINENYDYISDIKLMRAQNICTKLFQTRTESKIQLVAKHIIFRVALLVATIACLTIIGILVPTISIIFIPFALYYRGRETTYNNVAFLVLKIPGIIHSVCLTLRMVVNPLQFVKETKEELELDTSPIINAFIAPSNFWKNALEFNES
ncbi:MAG: hypothetical protein L0207_00950 [Chlamydiae bacterium]|nr:hypothetical protein [Chlamydiota bacterium]